MIRRFARPYARALMGVAGTPEKAASLRDELQGFEGIRSISQDLQALFANPGIEVGAKLRITETIAAKLGMSPLGVRALEVLIRNHRINDLPAIIEGLSASINSALDIATAEVRTAHELAPAEKAELEQALGRKTGKRVDLRLTTDPTLLGGFIARIGSEIYDASVTGKIHKFQASLNERH